jgi:hypothetical protein
LRDWEVFQESFPGKFSRSRYSWEEHLYYVTRETGEKKRKGFSRTRYSLEEQSPKASDPTTEDHVCLPPPTKGPCWRARLSRKVWMPERSVACPPPLRRR